MTVAIGYTALDMITLAAAAFLVGLRRGGIQGPEVLAVVLLAARFTPAASVGIAVIIFLYADVQATVLLFPGVDWGALRRLLGPTVLGVAAGAFAGRLLPVRVFEWVFFVILLSSYGALVVQHLKPVPNRRAELPAWMAPVTGLLSGVTSMIGNMASLFVALYFAAAGARKEQFIATSAWFFFVLNVVKLPIHIWGWRTLSGEMLLRTLVLFPLVSLGIWVARCIVGILVERTYWRFVVAMVGLAVLRLFLVLVGGI